MSTMIVSGIVGMIATAGVVLSSATPAGAADPLVPLPVPTPVPSDPFGDLTDVLDIINAPCIDCWRGTS